MISLYRKIAVTEGISYLILLGIAMPLKYFFGFPHAVKYFGWIHGILFLIFLVVLIAAAVRHRWSLKRIIIYLIASVLPVIPFLLDRQLKKEYPASKL